VAAGGSIKGGKPGETLKKRGETERPLLIKDSPRQEIPLFPINQQLMPG